MAEPLLHPRAGLPELIIDRAGFLACLQDLAAGFGPIAIDAERASGYRYSQRAYLIQIFRREGGLHLIDPIAVNEESLWKEMNDAFIDCEWIIHASTQDLPCLRELGIAPKYLFDTELGGRIAGCERVGLGPLCESLLDLALAKEHSAVDWSIRPLREEWLNYAALDVDVLVDLRDQVEKLLIEKGKLAWAQEDFAQILNNTPPAPRKDPWRRTSGMHKIKDRMTLAIIRALWHARDEFARSVDISPGRIFNDEVLIEIATKRPEAIDNFNKIVKRRTRVENLPTTEWFTLLHQTLQLPIQDLPELRLPSSGLPVVKLWKDRNPLGYARLSHARAAVIAKAAELEMPVENLISPDAIRQLTWQSPPETDVTVFITATLAAAGARPWQIAAVGEILIAPLAQTEPLPPPPTPEAPEAEADSEPTPEE